MDHGGAAVRVRVAVVDDHPAVRAGLEAVLDDAAGIAPVGSAAGELDLWPLLHRTVPDLVLMDHQLEGMDGLHLCRRIKEHSPAPRVLVFSAFACGEMDVAATLAGADGLLNKGVPAQVLAEAIRAIGSGDARRPVVTPELLSRAARCVDRADVPVLSMLVQGTRQEDVCEVLGLDEAALGKRLDRMIAALAGCGPQH